jgi:ABC-type antimicrobial peptide transport system permease subunit
MFFLNYVRNELFRRRTRTILTAIGLGLGVALVVSISAISNGLDHAQKTALNPLSGIGTDLTVTRAAQTNNSNSFGGPFGGGPGGGGDYRDLLAANSSVITDLSKLGKPGQHFVHDFFLPGTQLTFPVSQVQQIEKIGGVAAVSEGLVLIAEHQEGTVPSPGGRSRGRSAVRACPAWTGRSSRSPSRRCSRSRRSAVSEGLVLIAEHQEGTVPKIVATLKAGGQTFNIRRQITPPTAAEQQQIRSCIAKLAAKNGSSLAPAGTTGSAGPTGAGGFGRRNNGGGGFGGGGANGGGFRLFGRGAFSQCFPARFRQFRTNFTTPTQTLRQVLDPPQTNIKTEPYTIGGVNTNQPSIGLITPAQVTKGRYFSKGGGKEALLAPSYASKNGLKVGSKLTLNGTTFTVVGVVSPPLGGQTADVYLPLAQLQKLAGEAGLANVAFVRSDSSGDVAKVEQEIKADLVGSQVASEKDVAKQITGSLVDASNLSSKLGLVLSIVAVVAAFLIAALLTLTSVGKRVRELGTLKALGWTQRLVVRQILGESLAVGIIGGALGIGLGILIAGIVDGFGPTLTASSLVGGSTSLLGAAASRTASTTISLDAPLTVWLIVIGFGVALLGGLVAGGAGALRAARLRPADALRQLE